MIGYLQLHSPGYDLLPKIQINVWILPFISSVYISTRTSHKHSLLNVIFFFFLQCVILSLATCAAGTKEIKSLILRQYFLKTSFLCPKLENYSRRVWDLGASHILIIQPSNLVLGEDPKG